MEAMESDPRLSAPSDGSAAAIASPSGTRRHNSPPFLGARGPRDGETGAGETVPSAPARRSRSWLSTFGTGLVLWVATVIVTGLTGNIAMVPTVILLGSFLIPATAVIWYLDHYHSDVVTPALAARAFIVGGVLGVLGASTLEALLLSGGPLLFLSVGLIEELAKLLGVLFVARRLPRYYVRDGIVLGAAVGFGFAALESSGYALNALIVRQGSTIVFSFDSLVVTEILRGILAPLGHGLWTALVGGAIFGCRRPWELGSSDMCSARTWSWPSCMVSGTRRAGLRRC